MTTSTTTRKIPTPLYAAAGAGDLAYQQLRKLPAQVAQLRARVEELRPAVTDAVAETNLRADLTAAADRLRDAARRWPTPSRRRPGRPGPGPRRLHRAGQPRREGRRRRPHRRGEDRDRAGRARP